LELPAVRAIRPGSNLGGSGPGASYQVRTTSVAKAIYAAALVSEFAAQKPGQDTRDDIAMATFE